jgi:thioredoxin 1
MTTRKKYEMKVIITLIVFVIVLAVTSCGNSSLKGDHIKTGSLVSKDSVVAERHYKVTFIELGSVRCIPCQQMQSVMKSIETKYGNEVKVDFHDVWTEAGKPYGVKYAIEAIPTQVFLDETGKEYYRHVGFLPEEELVKVLQMKGVKLN